MTFNVVDHGLVLKKRIIRDNLISLSIFSSSLGKLVLQAWGVKKITSRRLSHLETGNYIKFSYRHHNNNYSLEETELIYAYSKIRNSLEKLKVMYTVLFILDKILPQHQQEQEIFDVTLSFLKKLNNQDLRSSDVEQYLTDIFIQAGFITQESTMLPLFNIYKAAENIIGEKIRTDF